MVKDLQTAGSNITKEDFAKYQHTLHWPMVSEIRNKDYTISSVPPPASGIVLVAIMNILDTFPDFDIEDDIFYHRIVESFKWAYGVRSKLGDPFDEEIEQDVL